MCTSYQYTIDDMFWISAYKIYSRHIIMPLEIIEWDKLSKVLIYWLLILEVYLWIRLSIETKTPQDCTSIIRNYWRSKTVERKVPFHGFLIFFWNLQVSSQYRQTFVAGIAKPLKPRMDFQEYRHYRDEVSWKNYRSTCRFHWKWLVFHGFAWKKFIFKL